jgi:hypothetical protein
MQRDRKPYTTPKFVENGSIRRMTAGTDQLVPQDADLIHQFDPEGSVGFLL